MKRVIKSESSVEQPQKRVKLDWSSSDRGLIYSFQSMKASNRFVITDWHVKSSVKKLQGTDLCSGVMYDVDDPHSTGKVIEQAFIPSTLSQFIQMHVDKVDDAQFIVARKRKTVGGYEYIVETKGSLPSLRGDINVFSDIFEELN